MARFNAPPNWPAPPDGWEPWDGWEPPASWPDPPAGWQMWIEDDTDGPDEPFSTAPAVRGHRTVKNSSGARAMLVGVAVLAGAVVAAVAIGKLDGAVPRGDTALSVSAEAGTVSTAAPSPSASATAPAAPTLTLSCASAGSSAVFGHTTTATGAYAVTISYGDGRSYTGSSVNPAAVFSHTYSRRGTYTVSAVLTDAAGARATGTCHYTW